MQSFKETVQIEVQFYAGVVASSCATALSRKKLRTVVKSIQATEDRSRNIMIHGLAEKNGEDLKKSVSDISARGDTEHRGEAHVQYTVQSREAG